MNDSSLLILRRRRSGSIAALLALASLHPAPARAQQPARVRLSGHVRSAASSELIRHALLAVDDGATVAQSNEDGRYFLLLSPGSHRVRVRAVGYAPLDTTVTLDVSRTFDFALTRLTATLSAVTVQAERERPPGDPRAPDMSVAKLDLATIKSAPAVLGEIDPIRSLSLLPGVSRSSDFGTSFSVRGGRADQNLILLDESTIYNPAHILGFLSVFNSDAVDDVILYKGAIPARFGGRLSSVVDVHQREGNANEFAGLASVGLLASRALVEGPLPGHRGSFLVAGRRSYADLFLRASSDSSIRDNTAYFYDLNAQVNARLGTTGSVMGSGYLGRDRFAAAGKFGAGWGNKSGTLRWNQIFSERLFSKVTLAGSDYDYRLEFPVASDSVDWIATVRSLDFKIDEALHLSDRHTIEFGIEATAHEFRPGEVTPRGTSQITGKSVEPRHAIATAAYLGQELELGPRFSVHYGARLSAFTRRGAGTIYRYANDAPVVYSSALGRYEPGTVVDSTTYGKGAAIRTFTGVEPRFSARFGLTPTTSLKASYARTLQYLNLASRANSPTPLDVWEPTGPYIRPQRADQYAAGYAATLGEESYELSAETYYKRMHDVPDFIDGVDVVLNDKLETAIVQGEGRAYGLELYARKKAGRTTGWVSYTLGRSEQRFGPTADGGAGIDGGRYYPSAADKTHELSVVMVRPVTRRWTLGSTFSLASGLPATYPVSRYQVDGLVVPEFGPRNSARLPVYHRLDVNMTRTLGRGELQLGAFNVYNRFNAQSISFRQSERNPLASEAVQLSIFGIVPSVSYTLKF